MFKDGESKDREGEIVRHLLVLAPRTLALALRVEKQKRETVERAREKERR